MSATQFIFNICLISLAATICFVGGENIICPGRDQCMDLDVCNRQHQDSGHPLDTRIPLGRCSRRDAKFCCPPLRSEPSCIGPLQLTESPVTTAAPMSTTLAPLTEHRNFRLLPGFDACGFPSPYIIQPDLANKIKDGEESPRGAFPWMVLLFFENKFDEGNYRAQCGGTLINSRYVLTAAHCFTENSTIKYVSIGAHDVTESCEDVQKLVKHYHPSVDASKQCHSNVPVAKLTIHERYNFDGKVKNDIALLRLKTKVLRPGNVYIQPACLPFPTQFREVKLNEVFQAAGWGIQSSTFYPEAEKILRNVTIQGSGLCGICNSNGGNDTALCPLNDRTQLCILSERGSRDVCKGDSGGPIMVRREKQLVQVGIISAKPTEHCGAEGVPSIYTRVDGFLNWILDNITE